MCDVEGREREDWGGEVCVLSWTHRLCSLHCNRLAEDLGFICRRGSAFFVDLTSGEAGALGWG